MTATASMRGMVIDRFGGPGELHLADLPRPTPRGGEVLIRVEYAGTNPADWKCREGWLSQFFTYRFPFVLGFDASGVVTEVGPGVDGLRPGDRVVTASNQGKGEWGTYAEYVVSDIDRVARLPDAVSFEAAAALPTAGITAWEAVFDVAAVRPGQQVFVHGGAGGTGSYAIQLAHHAGARVVTTASGHNRDYVRSLGAELAIDYRNADVAAAVRGWAPDGVDVVIDTVGQGTLVNSIELVKRGGLSTQIATLIADEPHPDPERAAALGVRVAMTMASHERQGRQLRSLVAVLKR